MQRLYNPRLQEAVWRTQALLQEEERLLAWETDRLLAQVSRAPAPDFILLDLHRLLTLDPGWQLRLLRAALGRLNGEQTLSAAQTASLLDLARGEKSGGLLSLGKVRVARAGSELHIFRPLPAPPAGSLTLPAPSRWRRGVAGGLELDLEKPASGRRRRSLSGAAGGRAGPGAAHLPPGGPLLPGRRPLLAPGRPRPQETPGLPGGRQDSPLAAAPYSPGGERRPDRLGGRRPPGRTREGDRRQPHPLSIELRPTRPETRRIWDMLLACGSRT